MHLGVCIVYVSAPRCVHVNIDSYRIMWVQCGEALTSRLPELPSSLGKLGFYFCGAHLQKKQDIVGAIKTKIL